MANDTNSMTHGDPQSGHAVNLKTFLDNLQARINALNLGNITSTHYISANGTVDANLSALDAALAAAIIPSSTIKVVKKTIGWSGAAGVDHNLPSAANMTPFNIDLGAIIPALGKVLDVFIVCDDGSVFSGGATTLVAGIGKVTSGTEYTLSQPIYGLNTVVDIYNGGLIVTPVVAASHVWITDITPGANWSTQTAGHYTVYVTYNDINGI